MKLLKMTLCYSPFCVIHKDDPARLVLYISIVLMVLLKYFWDGIDFTLDLYIVYRLKKGEVIDVGIYRNERVIFAIFVFGVYGCICKLVTWKIFKNKMTLITQTRKFNNLDTARMKNMVMVAGFIFEDGPEMILEYCYIEKYVTTFSWLLLVKDIFVGIVAVCTCLNTLAYLFKDRKQVVLATRKKKKRVTVLQTYYLKGIN